jgi:hypothetical protein
MDQHVLLTSGLLGLTYGVLEIAHVGDGGPLRVLRGGLMATEDEDGYAVVVVAVPPARRLEGPAAGEHSPGGEEIVGNLAIAAVELVESDASSPFVEAFAAVPQSVLQRLVGTGDEAVEGHGHVQHGRRHGEFSFMDVHG